MNYDYDELDTLIDNAAREAAFAEYTHIDGWILDQGDNYVRKVENYGESSSTQQIYLDGVAYSSTYLGGSQGPWERDANLESEFAGKVTSWRGKLDSALLGWDYIGEGTVFDDVIYACQVAVQKVAVRGGDESSFPNPDLEKIGYIRKFIPDGRDAGATISAFYDNYGPDRLETVLGGHCEAIACLGIALTGEKNLLDTCRQDTANLVGNVATAFKDSRKQQSVTEDFKTALTIVTATAGLVGAFATGPAAAAFGALGASSSFLSTAVGLLPQDTADPVSTAGGTPEDVYTAFQTALSTLETKAESQDQGLCAMLTSMLGAVDDQLNRKVFHIEPGAGQADIGDDIIDLQYSTLEHIGYESMPTIARAFFEAADQIETSNQQNVWFRPSKVGIGFYGSYHDWQSLAYRLTPLLNDTGAETVRAGEALAEAAGYFRDSDDWAKDKLGDNHTELDDAELGWVGPYVPPPPTPPCGISGDHYCAV
ncbi:hypothetical protein FXB39_19535 [Nocardioides sp. BGMRC 2183]|nr:hypothetical protein FXB39_19535 [Nocardioides sp. BGMRC 2183]